MFLRAASIVACTALLAAAAAPQTIREGDFARLVGVGTPAISPDAKVAAIVVTRIEWNDDKRTNDLIVVDLTSGAQQTIVANREDLSDPAFAPDGRTIAFLAQERAEKDPQTQIFVVPASGGEPQQITHRKSGVDQYAWRPDGRAFAYASTDSDPTRTGAERFRDSFVFTTEPIVARALPQPARIFVVTLDDNATRQLTFGDRSVATGEAQSTLSWSPDATTIAFTLVPNAILNDQSYSRIALLDVASGAVRTPTGATAWEGDPIFSPDGRYVAYTCAKGDQQVNLEELCVIPAHGGAATRLSGPLDRPLASKAWASDSRSLFVVAPDRSTVALYRVPLAGKFERLDTGSVNIGSDILGAVASDGSIAFEGSSTKQPPELFMRGAGGDTRKLTAFNAAIAGLDLAEAQRVTFPTTTGVRGDGVLYLPPGLRAGQKYPLVLYVHGGPTSSSTLAFSFWAQVMAAHGWLVLQPNYRGSDDLGLKYQRAVLYDPEAGPGRDIMAAVNAVRARGIVDDSRIAVGGWSYGGIMTAWMISRYHIWRAAVSGASVDDWITDYGTADDSLNDADLFHGSPFLNKNLAEWRRASAISYVADVTTPVLILSDVGDNRDSFATSSMYWRALRDNHKDATLRVWPIDGHFPRDPVRTVDVYHFWIGYIAQHFR